MDLLNETVGAYAADKAYPASYYVEKFSYDSGFEVGLNEVSNLNRKLSWEGETTASERILSVATQFDAEVSYSFEIDRLRIRHKYINLHKKRGTRQRQGAADQSGDQQYHCKEFCGRSGDCTVRYRRLSGGKRDANHFKGIQIR